MLQRKIEREIQKINLMIHLDINLEEIMCKVHKVEKLILLLDDMRECIKYHNELYKNL